MKLSLGPVRLIALLVLVVSASGCATYGRGYGYGYGHGWHHSGRSHRY